MLRREEGADMKAYSIKSGVLQINGVIISGLASGDDVIVFEPFADAATAEFGADGFLEVSISAHQGGTLTVKTQQTSDVNYFFQQFYNNQIFYGDSFEPLNGSWRANDGSNFTLAGGVLTHQPPIGFGEHATPREWQFVFERMILNFGRQSALATLS
jgi:hypothetical protein